MFFNGPYNMDSWNEALVEVDTETGIVRPLKIVMVLDCRTIIKPKGAREQIVGRAAHALGHTLF